MVVSQVFYFGSCTLAGSRILYPSLKDSKNMFSSVISRKISLCSNQVMWKPLPKAIHIKTPNGTHVDMPFAEEEAFPTYSTWSARIALNIATKMTFSFHQKSLMVTMDGRSEYDLVYADFHLGEDDFDMRIVDWVILIFERDEGINLSKDEQAFQRLKETVREAKAELVSSTQTNISLPYITVTTDGPKHIETILTRAKFEELCSDLFDRFMIPMEESLKLGRLSFKHLDEVNIWSRTTIPAVVELVRNLVDKYSSKSFSLNVHISHY